MNKKTLFKHIALDMIPYALVLGVTGAIVYTGYRATKKLQNAIDDIDWENVFRNL